MIICKQVMSAVFFAVNLVRVAAMSVSCAL